MVSEEPGLDAALSEREQALAKRAAELAERERAVQAMERRLHKLAASISAREAALPVAEAARSSEVVEGPKKEAEPLPAPEAEREAELYAEIELDELERLVRANRDEHPDLAESWEFTLYHLREYADVDGRLPLRFDGMIDEVFGPLLDS